MPVLRTPAERFTALQGFAFAPPDLEHAGRRVPDLDAGAPIAAAALRHFRTAP